MPFSPLLAGGEIGDLAGVVVKDEVGDVRDFAAVGDLIDDLPDGVGDVVDMVAGGEPRGHAGGADEVMVDEAGAVECGDLVDSGENLVDEGEAGIVVDEADGGEPGDLVDGVVDLLEVGATGVELYDPATGEDGLVVDKVGAGELGDRAAGKDGRSLVVMTGLSASSGKRPCS